MEIMNKEEEGRPPESIQVKELKERLIGQPLSEYRSQGPLALDSDASCLRCSRQYRVLEPECENPFSPRCRNDYQLCGACYAHVYFTGTPEGRAAVEKELDSLIPRKYASTEFNTLQCVGADARHLAEVLRTIIGWATDVAGGSRDSLYLYSKPGRHGTGCGNGKTHLLWSAFKYFARRTAQYYDDYDLDGRPRFGCRSVDVPWQVGDFMKRLNKCAYGEKPVYSMPDDGSMYRSVSFEQYRSYLAAFPIVFMDDIGSTAAYGLVTETYESLINMRVGLNLPTFYTSNYSPDTLGSRLGERVASRIFRTEIQIVEVRA